jgi:hypothetical protein
MERKEMGEGRLWILGILVRHLYNINYHKLNTIVILTMNLMRGCMY